MSFFNLSTGENATQNQNGSFEMGSSLEPIPNDTNVLTMCEEAKISEYEGKKHISLKWRIQSPEAYKNRIIFQKVQVWELDSQKRDKAIRMLAAIDSNAGGKLAASGSEPNDISMASALLNKPMVLKLAVWEIDDKKGNWVQAVSKYNAKVAQATTEQSPSFDDSIPF